MCNTQRQRSHGRVAVRSRCRWRCRSEGGSRGPGGAGGRARPRVWRGELVAANRRWLPWCSADGTATREAGGGVHGRGGNVSMARVQASLHSWRWIGGPTPPTRKSTMLSRRGIS